MKEKTLIILCFFAVIAGIIIMFIMSSIMQLEYSKVSDVNLQQNLVKLEVKVISVFNSEGGTTFLKVKDDSGVIDVVVFKNSIPNINDIELDMTIEVLGKPEKYKEKLEIIANRIQVVNSDLV
jgi:RecJ-like exonuclease